MAFAIRRESWRSTRRGSWRRSRAERAVVAGVADHVVVVVLLPRVGHDEAVVEVVGNHVAVAIGDVLRLQLGDLAVAAGMEPLPKCTVLRFACAARSVPFSWLECCW